MYSMVLCVFIYSYKKRAWKAYTKMLREIYTVLGLARNYYNGQNRPAFSYSGFHIPVGKDGK